MEKYKKYPIEDFYVGELYLYTNFGNLLSVPSIQENNNKIQEFNLSGAINFQKYIINRYIDWENRREYTGFLTIFYKQGTKYICLHDGVSYELEGDKFLDNLIPLNELLPKIDTQLITKINISKALQLFDILFKKNKDESQLYNGNKYSISDFYVGDLSLKEIYHQQELPDSRSIYIDLPQHTMLGKNSLTIYGYGNSDYTYTVYRCLFLRDIVDLYNINNNQFYNNNEDSFERIMSFEDYITNFDIKHIPTTLSIPKALKLFKKTIR